MVTTSDYAGLKPAWCPGCGNFGILRALNKALAGMEIEPHQVLLVSGIGQAGKLPHYTRGNVFNSLHGRPLPPAIGARIANPELVVIAISGDGDAYGEGGNHFLHASRRNHDITYLVHNNQIYGLTKGQASPTSDVGFVTKTTPRGAAGPVNPVALAVVNGASLVCRGFAGDIDHLAGLIQKGITHRGFALIDVLQPCVVFNRRNTFQWYKERVYKLEEASHDPGDKKTALEKALEWGDRIPIGIIYKADLPVYEDQLAALGRGPLVQQQVDHARVEKLFAEFM
ncbi:MAG: 2-oxoacid:ferredoxin oxidoreductase subunit beta [Dehalococcoidia bacterium]|nr:2-oxoacid:ferredoxin oxidoreductase subunit beta [Dehalococcoidia bacterium]